MKRIVALLLALALLGCTGCSLLQKEDGGSDLSDLCQDGIVITIQGEGFHILVMTGGISLGPQLLTATAEIGHFSTGNGLFEGFLCHISQHENFVGFIILSDDRNHAVTV